MNATSHAIQNSKQPKDVGITQRETSLSTSTTKHPLQLKNNIKIKLVNHPQSTKNSSSSVKNASSQQQNFFSKVNTINNQIVKASRNYGIIQNNQNNNEIATVSQIEAMPQQSAENCLQSMPTQTNLNQTCANNPQNEYSLRPEGNAGSKQQTIITNMLTLQANLANQKPQTKLGNIKINYVNGQSFNLKNVSENPNTLEPSEQQKLINSQQD